MTIMNIYHVKHLPLVEKGKLIGLISEEDILTHGPEKELGDLEVHPNSAYVYGNDHLFDVIGKLGELHVSTIPVLNENEDYVGLITLEDVLQYYANSFSFKEPGSIIVIETHKSDYSLAEVSRIIEAENAKILSSFLTLDSDSNNVLLTLKVNRHDVQHIIATLKRYDYDIRASFTEDDYFYGLKERYDALMKYLSV